jgi:predicted Zn-dependent protease
VVPRLAAAKASGALVSAASPSGQDLHRALASALDASRLDPVSDAGLRAASTIAVRLGRTAEARRFMLQAVRREPTDGQAWQQLAYEDFVAGADGEALAAAQRALALDPRGSGAAALVRRAILTVALPAQSATASVTPRQPPAGRRH